MDRASRSLLAIPAVQRLKRVAIALGNMVSDIVFIGGSIAPLLQVDPPFSETRPTKDVDGVMASTTYADLGVLAEALRARSFYQSADDSAHIHRWRTPAGDAVDLVPAGAHLGGSGQLWDRLALENFGRLDLGDGVQIRHVDAPTFLALKWAAFHDRGSTDPYGSHDLEDILALIASRPTVAVEIDSSPQVLKDFVATETAGLLRDERVDDILAGHLNNTQDPGEVARMVLARMRQIVSLSRT